MRADSILPAGQRLQNVSPQFCVQQRPLLGKEEVRPQKRESYYRVFPAGRSSKTLTEVFEAGSDGRALEHQEGNVRSAQQALRARLPMAFDGESTSDGAAAWALRVRVEEGASSGSPGRGRGRAAGPVTQVWCRRGHGCGLAQAARTRLDGGQCSSLKCR